MSVAAQSPFREDSAPASPFAGEPYTVRLWDGRAYNRAAVARISPALVAYADKHACLSEELTEERHSIWGWLVVAGVITVFLVLAVPGFLAMVYVVMARVPYPDRPVTQAMIEGTVVTAWLLFVDSFWCLTRWRLEVLSVQDGVVRMSWGPMYWRASTAWALHDCWWSYGWSWNDRERGGFQNRPCVCLSHPWGARIHFSRQCLACGFTPEMREVWTSFLQVAAIRRCRNRMRWEWAFADLTAGVVLGTSRMLLDVAARLSAGHPVLEAATSWCPIFFALAAMIVAVVYGGEDRFAIEKWRGWWFVIMSWLIMLFLIWASTPEGHLLALFIATAILLFITGAFVRYVTKVRPVEPVNDSG